jgi:hypothetical protein
MSVRLVGALELSSENLQIFTTPCNTYLYIKAAKSFFNAPRKNYPLGRLRQKQTISRMLKDFAAKVLRRPYTKATIGNMLPKHFYFMGNRKFVTTDYKTNKQNLLHCQ